MKKGRNIMCGERNIHKIVISCDGERKRKKYHVMIFFINTRFQSSNCDNFVYIFKIEEINVILALVYKEYLYRK